MSRVLVFRPAYAAKWTAFLLPSLLTLLATGFRPAPLRAEQSKAERERELDATVLVTHALAAEAEGKTEDRDALLKWALEKLPDFAPALWHSGFVRLDYKWVKADDVPKFAAHNKELGTYNDLRQKYPQTVDGQLKLAHWCAQHKLPDQERAHLTKVLELDSNNAEARTRLHFVFLDGTWRSEQEIRAAAFRAERTAASVKKWSPRLKQIVKMLDQTGGRSVAAANRLRSIQDPEAIPAMELALANLNEASSLLLADILSKMRSAEASLALARLAVTTAWPNVREAAAEKLKSRSEDDYIPSLLSVLSSPLQSKRELYQTPDGRLVYNHSFYREVQEHKELAVFQSAFQTIDISTRAPVVVNAVVELARPMAEWRRRMPLETAIHDQTVEQLRREAFAKAQGTALIREAARHEINSQIEAQNLRICEVLAVTTGQDLPASPDAWWEWWNDYNEIVTDCDKPVHEYYEFTASSAATQATQPPPVARHGCLPAGTPVWTLTGALAIERIKIGDLVLSQNPDTGELAYKPVLRTTFRKEARLVRFQAGEDEIQSTPGHAFWVNGSGWVRARQLETGTRLHVLAGAVRVEAVGGTKLVVPVHNLVVADFHTYFVGTERILSHDITDRKAVDATPLGLPNR